MKEVSPCGITIHELGQIVPGIDASILNCSFYLFSSEEQARAGECAGGTGFLVSVKSTLVPSGRYFYAVTNAHVVEAGCTVIRMNTGPRTVAIHPTEQHRWRSHPNRPDDVAVLPMLRGEELCSYVDSGNNFATPQLLESELIMVGDEVFMVGRYMDKPATVQNEPSARFGNLAMMPGQPVETSRGMASVFLVELRSHGGYSGSPVVVYVPPNNIDVSFGPRKGKVRKPSIWLLGVNSGHIPIPVSIYDPSDREAVKDVVAEVPGGFTKVVPAWKLQELLHIPELVELRKNGDAEYLK